MNNLCALGFQLSEKAAIADRDFKARLLEFFSGVNKRDDERRHQLEALGVQQREADDAFLRHYRGCMSCRETAALMHRSA
jgi:hypothetical protein